MHASYGFLMYIIKFIAHQASSAFYPYPAITSVGLLLLLSGYPLYLFILICLLVWTATKKGEIPSVIVFGFMFYFFTIAMVLQFVSVGKAIIADRYTYIPYIGLSFILGMLTDYLIQKTSSLKNLGYALAIATLFIVVVFSFMTFERTKVWNNDIVLWSDVLQKYPDGPPQLYIRKAGRTIS